MTTPAAPPLRLDSTWETGDDFMLTIKEADGRVRFFHRVAGPADLPDAVQPGSLVSVFLRFEDREADFHVHATVRERVTEASRPGLVLEFLPEEEARQELVLACAQGDSVPYFRRQHGRFPCATPARVWIGDDVVEAATIDISEGGAQIAVADARLKLDQMVAVGITMSDGGDFRVAGRVSFVAFNAATPAIGVEFRFSSAQQRDAVVASVRRLLRP